MDIDPRVVVWYTAQSWRWGLCDGHKVYLHTGCLPKMHIHLDLL